MGAMDDSMHIILPGVPALARRGGDALRLLKGTRAGLAWPFVRANHADICGVRPPRMRAGAWTLPGEAGGILEYWSLVRSDCS